MVNMLHIDVHNLHWFVKSMGASGFETRLMRGNMTVSSL